MTVTISARGQMVIPASIRKKYGINAQSKVELIDLGNEVVIVPTGQRPLSNSKGILRGVSTQDLIKMRRIQRRLEHSKNG